jgi:hypothetical protein
MKTRIRGRLSLAWGLAPLLLLSANCGDTLDLGGDLAVGGQGDSSGSAGEAGQGGPTMAGTGAGSVGGSGAGGSGVAGGVGISGAGGVAGTFGVAGSGSSGGSSLGGVNGGGEPPAPPVLGEDCKGRPLGLDPERLRQCVLLVSCAGNEFDNDVSRCVQGDNEVSFHFYDKKVQEPWRYDLRGANCLGALRTCDDVLACLGSRVALDECADGQTTRCEGELAITCNAQDESVIDCQKSTGQKGACQVLGDGAAAHAECVVDAPCTASTRINDCHGDVTYRCQAPDLAFGADCGQFGLTCKRGVCATRTVPEHCDEPATAGCDGSVIRACSPSGELFERDCSRFIPAMVCSQTGGDEENDNPWYDCEPKGCYWPFDNFDSCRGDDLVAHVDNDSELRVHCPDYGFATCSYGRCVIHGGEDTNVGGGGGGGP